ncbi:MAG: bifunctional folylpolyglutamate synthase/dihydrofolate synthase [Ruminiclostridium sp.]|nr:bifunctional folylpolyglutamate synthase/dihydrofolate synthase [Ruminiclostridium sp.]
MNYSQAIEYLNGFSKSGTPVADLSRFSELMRVLGDPQKELDFVHVAGTNGKGSVCEYVSLALQRAGNNTGKFTSPYINVIEERIQVNNKPISQEDFALYISMAKEGADRTGCEDYSQFEILNAAAFLCFKDKKCGITVLETGIGGLLDSTNIISPKISVITTVDLDHTAMLGGTRQEIARHKAGIIKRGCPVVVSPDQFEEVVRVLEDKARELNAPFVMPADSDIKLISADLEGTVFKYKGERFKTKMCGKHQAVNAAAAIETLRLLNAAPSHIKEALLTAAVPARTEQSGGWIIDGAHNPSGAGALAELLKTVKGTKVLLTGMLTTKDWQGSLEKLVPLFDCVIAVDFFAENAVEKEKIAQFAQDMGKKAVTAESLEEGFQKAEEQNADYRILCGSLYLCGAARRILSEK